MCSIVYKPIYTCKNQYLLYIDIFKALQFYKVEAFTKILARLRDFLLEKRVLEVKFGVNYFWSFVTNFICKNFDKKSFLLDNQKQSKSTKNHQNVKGEIIFLLKVMMKYKQFMRNRKIWKCGIIIPKKEKCPNKYVMMSTTKCVTPF